MSSHRRRESPSQTAGPYVQIGLTPNTAGIGGVFPEDLGSEILGEGCSGQRITVSGTIYDGTGAPLKDALIEVWQADANGLYAAGDPRGTCDPAFKGWTRQTSDSETGIWAFKTIKPGTLPFPGGRLQAPHITFWIVARGLNIGLHTRMYFPDEDNASDPFMSLIEPGERAQTLVAVKTADGSYRFDVHLQGPHETVFFDV